MVNGYVILKTNYWPIYRESSIKIGYIKSKRTFSKIKKTLNYLNTTRVTCSIMFLSKPAYFFSLIPRYHDDWPDNKVDACPASIQFYRKLGRPVPVPRWCRCWSNSSTSSLQTPESLLILLNQIKNSPRKSWYQLKINGTKQSSTHWTMCCQLILLVNVTFW